MQVRRRRYDRTVLVAGQLLRGQDTYRVGDVVGEGGYAVVYAATSSKNLPVALKEFVPGGTVQEREQVLGLFARERDIMWRLRGNPHLPDLIEAFSQDGMHYLVLAFVQGESLRERLDRAGPVGSEEAGSIVLQIARALADLHFHGVVHHDVKPANIKLSPVGLAMLLDVGSARFESAPGQRLRPLLQDLQGRLAESGADTQVAGTAGYMAPELREMVENDCVQSTCALDVFALGCTMHELLTNRRLPQEEIDARNQDVIEAAVREIRARCPELAEPLRRAISLDVQQRYPSAREMLVELEKVIPPRPAARPSRLVFDLSAGAIAAEQSLTITNVGGGQLLGSLRCAHPALGFRLPDGSVTQELELAGNVTLARVVANPQRVPAGREEEGQIQVSGPHGELQVTCLLSRLGARPMMLAARPTQAVLLVTEQAMQQVIVKVRNTGGEGGQVISEAAPPCVEVIPPQEYLPPGGETEFCIRPALALLRRGVHHAAVVFRAESGESEAAVRVTVQARRLRWGGIVR